MNISELETVSVYTLVAVSAFLFIGFFITDPIDNTQQLISSDPSPISDGSAFATTSESDSNTVNLQKHLQTYFRFDNAQTSRGNSLELDGSDDYIEVADSPSLDSAFGSTFNFTLTGWVYMEGWDDWRAVQNKAGCGSWSCTTAGLWTYTDGFVAVIGSDEGGNPSGSYVRANYKPELNKWHHVASVGNGTHVKLYVNGEEKDSEKITDYIKENLTTNDEPLTIGRRSTSKSESINGSVSQVKSYNRTLRDTEIEKLFDEKPVSRKGLVLHQDFNEGPENCDLTSNSACLTDKSGSKNGGTPANFDDNNLHTGTGWSDKTPLNRLSIENHAENSTTGRFYGGYNGSLQNFGFNASSGWINGVEGNSALKFGGNDERVLIENTPEIGNSSFSFSFWFKGNFSDSSKNYPNVFNRFWGRNTADDSGFRFDSQNTSRYIQGFVYENAYPSWTHIAVSVDQDDGIARFYENGTEIYTDSFSPGEYISSPSPIVMGNDNLNGSVDELLYYKRTLSSSEIKSLYNGKSPTHNLIGKWSFDSGDRSEVYDTSNAGYQGILNTDSFQFKNYKENVKGQTTIKENFTVSAWIDLKEIGSRERPGASCYEIKETNPSAVSGIYWVSPSNEKFKVYCDMERRGGGWSMLMKLEGQNSTFQYNSNYWENNQTLNMHSTETSENIDAKFPTYHQLNITQIRAEFPEINHNMNETFNNSTTSKTLFSSQNILGHENESGRVGDYGDFDKNEFAYQDGWQDYGFKLYGCNSRSKVRWGWIWNNEDDQCSSSDAGAGIGLTGEDLDDTLQSGSWATCCATTPTGKTEGDGGGEGDFPHRAILWGRESKPSKNTDSGDIQHQSLYKLYITPNMLKAKLIGSASNETITYKGKIPDGFAHVSLSYNGTTAALYIDGKKMKEKAIDLNLGSSEMLSIGEGYRGKMDEVKIYNRPLSEEEIQRLVFQ